MRTCVCVCASLIHILIVFRTSFPYQYFYLLISKHASVSLFKKNLMLFEMKHRHKSEEESYNFYNRQFNE